MILSSYTNQVAPEIHFFLNSKKVLFCGISEDFLDSLIKIVSCNNVLHCAELMIEKLLSVLQDILDDFDTFGVV